MSPLVPRINTVVTKLPVVLLIASLVLCLASEVTSTSDKKCKEVGCKKPPENSSCKEVDQNDKTVPRPKGEKAECCPLWKCKNKDSDYFTFHGLDGDQNLQGTETVHYSHGANIVRSVATGKHGATAVAGGGPDKTAVLNQVQDIIKSFGLG